jgi:adenylate cyclase
MTQSRQLAAVMFTDLVGYTALMGVDEKKAFELLDKNRILQKPIIEEFRGRWIKELGDGILSSFSTVSDAVNAAVKIQKDCNEAGEFQLRIGIHQGEVVFDSDDIFGDAVNIASRIQAIAEPGGIYISESVHHNIYNKQEISTRFVKQEILKNVKEPVKIYEVQLNPPAHAHKAISKPLSKSPPEKSVAVLPFINLSNDPEQEYFSEGITEDILNSLSHLNELKVAGRISSSRFKAKDRNLRDVARRLNVRTVLDGTIRKQANRVRISAQLINVEDGFHLWSEKYDREMDDIFAIEDEIALAITEQLKITLLTEDRQEITKSSTKNPEAYENYLKGRFHINRRGNSILKGIDFFQEAAKLDPGFALAHSGYADACLFSSFYSFLPANVISPKAKVAAETAINIDNSLAEPYCSLGLYNSNFSWNWAESKKFYLKSIELNPRYAQAHSFYGMLLLGWVEGKFEEAEKQGQLAIKLEPLSAIDHADLAWTLYTAHRFDDALALALSGIELDSNSFLSRRLAGLCYIALGRNLDAIEILQELVQSSGRHQHALNTLIWALCKKGQIEVASAILLELEERATTEFIATTHLGISAAYLGDIEKAFNLLETGLEEHDSIIVQLKYSPFVPETLKNDNRYQKLIEKIGYPV